MTEELDEDDWIPSPKNDPVPEEEEEPGEPDIPDPVDA